MDDMDDVDDMGDRDDRDDEGTETDGSDDLEHDPSLHLRAYLRNGNNLAIPPVLIKALLQELHKQLAVPKNEHVHAPDTLTEHGADLLLLGANLQNALSGFFEAVRVVILVIFVNAVLSALSAEVIALQIPSSETYDLVWQCLDLCKHAWLGVSLRPLSPVLLKSASFLIGPLPCSSTRP
jgi:hypothetical protein